MKKNETVQKLGNSKYYTGVKKSTKGKDIYSKHDHTLVIILQILWMKASNRDNIGN
jgi:hypothetical protein